MTPAQHYVRAERLADLAENVADPAVAAALNARALVHATLATAGAEVAEEAELVGEEVTA